MRQIRRTGTGRYLSIGVLLLLALLLVLDRAYQPGPGRQDSSGTELLLQEAYANRLSDIQVQGGGRVAKILGDDRRGTKHQRFILRLESGQTLLVAHNIDLAPRIDGLAAGDYVAFYGEYEWNERGGVVHWTHHDPSGNHPDGWLEHDGKRYR